jgi:hypothetical protein
MYYLLYLSRASSVVSGRELASIMTVSRRNNGRDGVSGVLVYKDGVFLQLLEGEQKTVLRTYERISGDPRHTDPVILLKGPIEHRLFGRWSMGFHYLLFPYVTRDQEVANIVDDPRDLLSDADRTHPAVELLTQFVENAPL